MARVDDKKLSHYMDMLRELEFIQREDPVLSSSGGRRGRYFVNDPFLRFYYRFIVPNRGALSRGVAGRTVKAQRIGARLVDLKQIEAAQAELVQMGR